MSKLIRDSNRIKQTIDFSGLQNGKMHPSDIDAVLEYNNQAIIFIELKKIGNERFIIIKNGFTIMTILENF
jgi:hypothetical protein